MVLQHRAAHRLISEDISGRFPAGGSDVSMLSEFKSFAVKGNVMDMAVGIIIGGAFGKIVASFVKDVLMPPIGMLLGGVDFAGLAITLKQARGDAEAVLLSYGLFLQAVVDFLIIAFSIFLMIRWINSLKRKEEAAPPAPPKPSNEEILLGEIRDLLRK
jgi:large conductance mechanosensitive channel